MAFTLGWDRGSATTAPSPDRATVIAQDEAAVAGSGPASNGASPGADDQPLTGGPPRIVRLAAPSFGGVVRLVLIVVACGIALYLLWRVRGVVRLVGISLFVALALLPLVDALDKRIRAPRAVLILALYLLLLATVAVIGYVVVPSLIKQVGQLSHDAPRYAAQLRHNSTFRHYDNRYHITPS